MVQNCKKLSAFGINLNAFFIVSELMLLKFSLSIEKLLKSKRSLNVSLTLLLSSSLLCVTKNVLTLTLKNEGKKSSASRKAWY